MEENCAEPVPVEILASDPGISFPPFQAPVMQDRLVEQGFNDPPASELLKVCKD